MEFLSRIKEVLRRTGSMLGRKSTEANHMAGFVDRISSWLAVFHPDVQLVSMCHPRQTVLRFDKQEIVADLTELFRWFLDYPELLGSVFEDFIMEAKMELRNRPIPLFEDIIEFIFPQVRSLDFLKENSPRFGKGRLARIEIAPSLYVLFVMDEEKGMTFINNGHMEAWQVNPGSLFNIAVRNLLFLGKKLDDHWRMTDASGYAAAHVLVLDRIVDIRENGFVYAGIPHRDQLLVWPGDLDEDGLRKAREETRKAYSLASRPISPSILRVDARLSGGVEIRLDSVPGRAQ